MLLDQKNLKAQDNLNWKCSTIEWNNIIKLNWKSVEMVWYVCITTEGFTVVFQNEVVKTTNRVSLSSIKHLLVNVNNSNYFVIEQIPGKDNAWNWSLDTDLFIDVKLLNKQQ